MRKVLKLALHKYRITLWLHHNQVVVRKRSHLWLCAFLRLAVRLGAVTRRDTGGVAITVAVTTADASLEVLDVLLDRLGHHLELLHAPVVHEEDERKEKDSEDHLRRKRNDISNIFSKPATSEMQCTNQRSDKLRKMLFALWQCQSQPWKMGRATSKAPTTIRHVAVNLSSLFDFVCRSNTLLNIQHINEYSAYQWIFSMLMNIQHVNEYSAH